MKVVVIGAGYAGTLAANRLSKKIKPAEVTIVNQRPEFVERVRLHQLVAGTGTVAAPLTSMLQDGITSRVATVNKIGDGTIALDDGNRIDFDYAFLAVGSIATPLPGTVPIVTWEGATQARNAFTSLPTGSTVTVVGGGPTGIETAAEVAEVRPDLRVRLVGSSVADCFSHGAKRRVLSSLEQMKVDVIEDVVSEVEASDGQFDGMVHLQSGTSFSSDLTVWAIVSGIPQLAAQSGLEVDVEGKAIVDEYLRSVSDPRVFVVGDCAAVPGARKACQSALPQATHAANNLASLLKGRELKPFENHFRGLSISLGRKDAVSQFARPDDTMRRAYLSGRSATVVKELGSRGAKVGTRAGFGG